MREEKWISIIFRNPILYNLKHIALHRTQTLQDLIRVARTVEETDAVANAPELA